MKRTSRIDDIGLIVFMLFIFLGLSFFSYGQPVASDKKGENNSDPVQMNHSREMTATVKPQGTSTSTRPPNGDDRVIIQFADDYTDNFSQWNIVLKHKGWIVKNLDLINGLAAIISKENLSQLLKTGVIKKAMADIDVQSAGLIRSILNSSNDQTIPWGHERIQAPLSWMTGTGQGVRIAILDTGIDHNHMDLKANIKKRYNAIGTKGGTKDNLGHGTHIAGVIAAVDNNIGVVGTSPQAEINMVKVLYDDGIGFLSDLIEGIAWGIKNDMDVINLSLGCREDHDLLHYAIKKAHEAGITIVAAAGNIPGQVLYPAFYEETIAVSAVDSGDQCASFSGSGETVDVTAPGVAILSTFADGTYAVMDGTSISAAYVTGVVALVISTPVVPVYDTNVNGLWDPDEIKQKLQDSAETLGLSFQQQGWRLVRADQAVK